MKVFAINEEMRDCFALLLEYVQVLMNKGKIEKDEEVYEAISHIINDLTNLEEIERR